MKLFLLTFATTVILTQSLLAEEPTTHSDGPCMKIMVACKNAGYNKSLLIEKKSLSKDCMQLILNGQKVEDVNIDPKDVEACKIKKAEVKSKK